MADGMRLECGACNGDAELVRVEETLLGVLTNPDAKSGATHIHDPNAKRLLFRCSEGHEFSIVGYTQCWCGYTRRNG